MSAPAFAVIPQRNIGTSDSTEFVPCDDADAEIFAVFDGADPDNIELLHDASTRAEAEEWIAARTADPTIVGNCETVPADADTAPHTIKGDWPTTLTPDLEDILGRPCFTFIQWSQMYRIAGHEIPKSAEGEQAFFLHKLLCFWFAHGTEWKAAAEAELKQVHTAAAEIISERKEQGQ